MEYMENIHKRHVHFTTSKIEDGFWQIFQIKRKLHKSME